MHKVVHFTVTCFTFEVLVMCYSTWFLCSSSSGSTFFDPLSFIYLTVVREERVLMGTRNIHISMRKMMYGWLLDLLTNFMR